VGLAGFDAPSGYLPAIKRFHAQIQFGYILYSTKLNKELLDSHAEGVLVELVLGGLLPGQMLALDTQHQQAIL
jgi:hypothetical protein